MNNQPHFVGEFLSQKTKIVFQILWSTRLKLLQDLLCTTIQSIPDIGMMERSPLARETWVQSQVE